MLILKWYLESRCLLINIKEQPCPASYPFLLQDIHFLNSLPSILCSVPSKPGCCYLSSHSSGRVSICIDNQHMKPEMRMWMNNWSDNRYSRSFVVFDAIRGIPRNNRLSLKQTEKNQCKWSEERTASVLLFKSLPRNWRYIFSQF